MDLRPPKGILLDMGGTLLGEFAFDRMAARIRLLEVANNPRGVTLADYAEVSREFHETVWAHRDAHMVEVPVRAFWRLADERLGITFDMPPHEVERLFWSVAVKMRPEPGVYEALESIRALGLPVGVVSNSAFCSHAITSELDKHGMTGCFQFVMSSADYGIRKPHRSLMLTAAAKLGLAPEDIWFVGDSLFHDVGGACNSGMVSVWYNPQNRDCGDYHPDAILAHWSQIQELLG